MRNLFFTFFILGTFLISSCDTEPIDSALLQDIENPNNPNNPNNPGNQQGGDYFPRAINNQWSYAYDDGETVTITMTAFETINGKVYTKFDRFFTDDLFEMNEAESYIRREGDHYIYLSSSPDNDITEGISIEFSILRSNLNVGQTWTETNTISFDFFGISFETNIVTTGKIIAKNITYTVNNTTYNNVIVVENKVDVDNEVTKVYYWFAKDIGIIKSTQADSVNDLDSEQEFLLTNYQLN